MFSLMDLCPIMCMNRISTFVCVFMNNFAFGVNCTNSKTTINIEVSTSSPN